jgi:integrase
MFEKDVLPVIGNLLIQDITKAHISRIINALKVRKAKHTARNLLKLMRQMLRYAVSQGIIDADPTAALSIVKVTIKPTERERVLAEAEIRALSRQLPSAESMQSTECAIWLQLSTCCRIGELVKAKWEA